MNDDERQGDAKRIHSSSSISCRTPGVHIAQPLSSLSLSLLHDQDTSGEGGAENRGDRGRQRCYRREGRGGLVAAARAPALGAWPTRGGGAQAGRTSPRPEPEGGSEARAAPGNRSALVRAVSARAEPGGARRQIRARAGRRGGETETTGEIHHDMLLTLDDDAHRGARIRGRGPRRRSSSSGARGLQRKRRRREAGEERNLGD